MVLCESCQKRQVAVPVPPPPSVTQPAPQATAPAATNPAPSTPNNPQQAQEPSTYQVNKPPQPARKAVRPTTSSPAGSSGSAASAPPPASTPPKLGDILTPDEQKQYSASIDQSLSRAQASLNSIGGRQLNKDQQGEAEQVRNFIEQAKAARASDLAGAKSLAERAEVLARDLAASFR